MWQYNYTILPDELYHHGVKGMKWGVRRNRQSLGSRLKSKYALNSDSKKELAEVEGDPSKYTSTGHKKPGGLKAKLKSKYALNSDPEKELAEVEGDPSKFTSKKSSFRKERPKKEVHEDYVNRHTKKSVKEMSDQELRERINRIQMEQQYKKLTSVQTQVGQSVVGGILTNAAKQTATNYVSKYMTKGIDMTVEKVKNR